MKKKLFFSLISCLPCKPKYTRSQPTNGSLFFSLMLFCISLKKRVRVSDWVAENCFWLEWSRADGGSSYTGPVLAPRQSWSNLVAVTWRNLQPGVSQGVRVRHRSVCQTMTLFTSCRGRQMREFSCIPFASSKLELLLQLILFKGLPLFLVSS